jgi:hypothetical protein
MPDLRDELRAAMRAKGYTYAQLLEESGLKCDLSSLNRKLNGGQGLDADEGQALARVLGVRASAVDKVIQIAETLGVTVSWSPDKKRNVS